MSYLGDYRHLIEFPHHIGQVMPSPPIAIFLTTIASQAALRQRQGMLSRLSQRAVRKRLLLRLTRTIEYLLRILQVKKIPFTSYDLASDEEAKRLWRRKAPAG